MLRLHRATAIPDNRNMARRHPPASRSVIDQADSLDRRQSTLRFIWFRMRMDIGGRELVLLPRIHVIVESGAGGCIVDETNVDLAP
jgi:hypothetical protein